MEGELGLGSGHLEVVFDQSELVLDFVENLLFRAWLELVRPPDQQNRVVERVHVRHLLLTPLPCHFYCCTTYAELIQIKYEYL